MTPFVSKGSLYKTSPLAAGTQALLDGDDTGPAVRAGRVGQDAWPGAGLLHVAGPPRRLRESLHSAACSATPCSGLSTGSRLRRPNRPGATSAAPQRRRRHAALLSAARARSAPGAALASFKVPDDLRARAGPGRADRPPAGLDHVSTSEGGSGWCSICSIRIPRA